MYVLGFPEGLVGRERGRGFVSLNGCKPSWYMFKVVACLRTCRNQLSECNASVSLYNCLCNAGQAMMTAAEVFISLHSVDATKGGVPLRKVMACLDPCMKEDMRSTFPPEAMAVALQQLVTRYACSKL